MMANAIAETNRVPKLWHPRARAGFASARLAVYGADAIGFSQPPCR